MKESNLQKSIVKTLELLENQGVVAVFYSIPNHILGGAKNKAIYFANQKRLGMRSGVADLCVITADSKTYFLELKSVTGRLSQTQLEFKDRIDSLKSEYIKYFVIKSLDDFDKIFFKNS